MTQPDQTTPTALSSPEAERVTLRRWIGGGMPPGPWQSDASIFAIADDTSEVEVREFIPLSTLSRLVEELESRARTTLARYGVAAPGHDRGRHQALREAASLISESLPKGKSDGASD